MATTTPVYSWPVPTSTDYVADGAVAIEALGDAVDSTLSTALGGAYPGLRLVKKQTIGPGVSSVNVTSAFSATYDAYKIIVSGGAGSTGGANLAFKLGASTSLYYSSLFFITYSTSTGAAACDNNAAQWSFVGNADTNSIKFEMDLVNPFLAKYSNFRSSYVTGSNSGFESGLHAVATSYTDFTITPAIGTLTGGTIYVYGYGAS